MILKSYLGSHLTHLITFLAVSKHILVRDWLVWKLVDSVINTSPACCRVAHRHACATGAELCQGRQCQHHVYSACLPRTYVRVEKKRQGDADHGEGKNKSKSKSEFISTIQLRTIHS